MQSSQCIASARWRLPTREELVRSLTRHNRNASGVWDEARQRATYDIKPDKESPLWDPYAPLIYLWTADEVDEQRVWIVVYHGGVYAHPKNLGSSSHGFRAVRDPPPEPEKTSLPAAPKNLPATPANSHVD